MLVINTSGHELSDLARERIEHLIGPGAVVEEFGAWDVGTPMSGEALRETVAGLLARVVAMTPDFRNQPPTLILPGYSPSVAMLLALWHGMTGAFPRLIWLQRDEGGFSLPIALDLTDARQWGRAHLRFGAS